MVQATENTHAGGDNGGLGISAYVAIPRPDKAAETAPINNGINKESINVPTLIFLILLPLSLKITFSNVP